VAVHGNALLAYTTSKRSVRLSNACTNSRARARMSSSAYTYAGVPNCSATSIRSQPPISSRPRSFKRDPRG
jgi:hypothetical protein